MEVAVFGAGIAGLMTAISLRDQGHRCSVYERGRQAHDAGMGFILVPEGIACLERFGVHLIEPSVGRELDDYFCRDSSGKIIFEQVLPPGTRGVRRRDLTAALMGALGGDEPVLFDQALDGLEFDNDGDVSVAKLT